MGAGKIVFGMAVKNESQTLANSVASVEHLVDEIFISVDKTSDEATLKKAKELTPNVYRHEFVTKEKPYGSFCDMRNKMIKIAEDDFDADWFVWLDGHERFQLSPGATFEKLILASPGADVFMMPLIMTQGGNSVPQPRLWRCNIGIHWIFDFHNKLHGYKPERRSAVLIGFAVIHEREKQDADGIKKRDTQRFETLTRYFKNELTQHPDNTWALYYLGNAYAHERKHEEGIKWYLQGAEVEEWAPFKWQFLYYTACSYYEMKRYDEALELAEQASKLQKRAEVFMLVGDIKRKQGENNEAIESYLNASRCALPDMGQYVCLEINSYQSEPHAALADLFFTSDNWVKASIHAKEALKYSQIEPHVKERMTEIRDNCRNYLDPSVGTRPKVIVLNSYDTYKINFFPPIAEILEKDLDFRVYKSYGDVEEKELESAHAVFVEWCDENAIEVAKQGRAPRVVVRLHGYEAYSGLADQVMWSNVDDLIFVSDHVRKHTNVTNSSVKQHVIPNGIDLEKFKATKKSGGTNIGFVGNLNVKKNLPLLLHIMKLLPDEYILHVAGDWQQEPHLTAWWYDYIQHNELSTRVVMHGHRYDINRWLPEQIDYLISPSFVESFGMTIAEGMACGIKPLIHDRPGVRDLWPPECVFSTPGEAVRMVIDGEYDSKKYRSWVEERYDLNNTAEKIGEVIAGE